MLARFFRPPNHHTMNYVLFVFWLVGGIAYNLYLITQVGKFPPLFLTLMMLQGVVSSGAEILPRSQTTLAGVLRISGLVVAAATLLFAIAFLLSMG